MITKERILSVINEEELFRKFIDYNFIAGKAFRSELREDRHASASVFVTPSGKWLYKDFAGDTRDIFGYVMEKYHTDFIGALHIIAETIGLTDDGIYIPRHIPKMPLYIPKESRAIFKKEFKPWEDYEIAVWQQYGITESVLNEYGVRPIQWVQYISLEEFPPKESRPDYPIFYFPIPSDEDIGEKYYFPYDPDKRKHWLSNTRIRHIFGLKQIEDHKEKIAMAGLLAGQKDVMALYANTGIRSACLNSESSKLYPEIYLRIRKMSDFQFILYDNDKTGHKKANKLSKEFDLSKIDISKFAGYCTLKGSKGVNDTADWYKKFIKENRQTDWIKLLIFKAYENRKNRDQKLQGN